MKKENVIQVVLIILNIILLVISIIGYNYIYKVETQRQEYAKEAEKFMKENEVPTFKISKIVIYSSANAVDNSEDGKLQDIDISQFTDFAIYIDNNCKVKGVTAENTINELYINGIDISTNIRNANVAFNYKNPSYCGKFKDIENYKDDGLLFKIITTNDKNTTANYDENVFFTDCSNPIPLSYVNKDIVTHCSVNDTGSIRFDGSILKNANVTLDNLDTTIRFNIHLINNFNEEFLCNVKLDNLFKDDIDTRKTIYDGYVLKVLNFDDEFEFLKITKIK